LSFYHNDQEHDRFIPYTFQPPPFDAIQYDTGIVLKHTVIILSDKYRSPLPVGSFNILTWPIQLTAHSHGGISAGSDE
jgi:hypothetical protein